jgi:hypothetical protein
MPGPEGFDCFARKSGDVVISHHGKLVTTLRKAAAAKFLEDVKTGKPQELMARATGHYKRGNECRGSRADARRGNPDL